jgi:aspartokinase
MDSSRASSRHSNAIGRLSTSSRRPRCLDAIERELSSFCEVRIERGRALACLVGRDLLESPRLVSDVLATLDPIPLRMFCLGSSDINLTFVVDEGDAEEVVRRLHARFLEAE